jgi:hypothetical protein
MIPKALLFHLRSQTLLCQRGRKKTDLSEAFFLDLHNHSAVDRVPHHKRSSRNLPGYLHFEERGASAHHR